MLAPILHKFCWIINWFCLLYHILRHKNIKYVKFSNSKFQLLAYTAYRILQKITNLMGKLLTRPSFLKYCWSEMLPLRCYTTEEAAPFRNKVAKIISAKTNVETFNTYIYYAICFKHILQTCFEVISQNFEKGFTICLCDSWALLDFCPCFCNPTFLIMKSCSKSAAEK